MKRYSLILIFLLPFSIFSQTYYNYYDTTITFSDNDLLTTLDESRPGAPSLKYITVFIELKGPNESVSEVNTQVLESSRTNLFNINPAIKQVNDSIITYDNLKRVYDEYISGSDFYPSTIAKFIGNVYLSGQYYAALKVCLQQYEWKSNTIKTFNKIKITMKTKIQGTVKDANTSSGNRWYNFGVNYLKFKIGQEGIYRIYYDDLLNIGVNSTSIQSNKIQIYNYGLPIPIYVYDNNDGKFDEGDYIEFYSDINRNRDDYKKIVAEGKDYIDYMNRYTDTTIIWLTFESEDFVRIKPVYIKSIDNTDTIDYSLKKIHYEEDNLLWYYDAVEPRTQLPLWQEHKVWTWRALGSNSRFSLNLNLDNIIQERGMKAEVRLISNSSDVKTGAHKAYISLNDSEHSDTLTFNYKQTVNLKAKFDRINASDNKLTISTLPTQASFHQSLIDWIDIEYYSRNYIREQEKIIIDENVSRGVKAIKVNSISKIENLIAYKIDPGFSKMEILKNGEGSYYFVDSVFPGNIYLITAESNIQKPTFCGVRKFRNLSEETVADYLILTQKDLLESAEEYKSFLEENYGINVKVVLSEEIYDNYSYGYPFPEAIKEFLRESCSNRISSSPEYLLIIGDANYDYKNKFKSSMSFKKKNIFPSYGFPVSDNWFVIWNDSIPIPQIAVGRIPAVNNEQVRFYLEKHRRYLLKTYDSWNKSFMFFSGGDPSKPEQLKALKSANYKVFRMFINNPPVEGKGAHFYKTINPFSNFSNMSLDSVRNIIDEGAILISYIGHSGTQTWDNGILSVNDLMNKYENRYPLITDFGCSTGKFAEPDIVSFAEEFINNNSDGQAIVYFANSSWGYLSTSLNFPPLFYNYFLDDSLISVGKLFNNAKQKLVENSGLNDVVKVFCYCSHLFGDPIIKIKLPQKPDLVFKSELLSVPEEVIKDNQKNITVNLVYYNFGKSVEDSYSVRVEHIYNNVPETKIIRCSKYKYKNDFSLKIDIQNRPGEHILICTLDCYDEIDEYDDSNNETIIKFNVIPSDIRLLLGSNLYTGWRDTIIFLNPPYIENDKLEIQLSDNQKFQGAEKFIIPFSKVTTKFSIPKSFMNKRIWLKYKNEKDTIWSEIYSIAPQQYDWIFSEPLDTTGTKIHGLTYDSETKSWSFIKKEKTLKLVSAGQTVGSIASLQIDNLECFPTTYFWGIAAAVIDTTDLDVIDTKYFLYPSSSSAEELIRFVDTLSDNYYVAMAICDDGYQSVISYKGGKPVRDAIKKLGSELIDSVGYRDSWCLLGKKGEGQKQIYEAYKSQYNGLASIALNKKVLAKSGYILTPGIGKYSCIRKIYYSSNLGNNLYALCENYNNLIDTLIVDTSSDYRNRLTNKYYRSINFLIKADVGDNHAQAFQYVAADVVLPPELVTSYETININKDTVYVGENIILSFEVLNAGGETASDFDIKILVNGSDEYIINVDSIESYEAKKYIISIGTENYDGAVEYEIIIDTENKIKEFYEDNNIAKGTFYVKQEIARQDLYIRIDGYEIYDGDYISQTPLIDIELFDYSHRKLSDTSYMKIFLNGQRVSYSWENVQYSFSDNNPKIKVAYNPRLFDGEYILEVFVYDFYSDTTKLIKSLRFRIDRKPRVLDVYNYPNPFESETFFTFRLTQIPDELKIKIFTVAGRLIKEIVIDRSSLKYDLNRVLWDGRDNDGNIPANGIYLYKMILNYGDKIVSALNKLAILR
ncbi:C25 family cysteine peptidase [Melioribacter sp. OK-6-Me]|uniref:C25 family cysteine peptidase n=1 Tax=unclassified Melioribacter TaxID=2627329 RepID=UPI003ED91003